MNKLFEAMRRNVLVSAMLVLAALVFFACLVAIQSSPATAAAWPYWPAVKLVVQALAVVAFVLLLSQAVKVDVQIGDNPPNSPELHRQNLELQAMQHVAVAAVLNGNKQAGERARAAIDQLLGVGSLEYAKESLDEPAKRVAAHWQELAAQQACTCTGNQACSNCPPQRGSAVKTPPAADDTEALIQAKGKTAPRITPADIEANIVGEQYFTAEDGADHSSMVDFCSGSSKGLGLLTFCVLVLRNGTKVVGVNYGAIDPARHDPEMGRTEARKAAIEQVWPLMGYELRSQLAQSQGVVQAYDAMNQR